MALVGRCVEAHIPSAEKWCVKAELLNIVPEAATLPPMSLTHPAHLPAPGQIGPPDSLAVQNSRRRLLARAAAAAARPGPDSEPHGARSPTSEPTTADTTASTGKVPVAGAAGGGGLSTLSAAAAAAAAAGCLVIAAAWLGIVYYRRGLRGSG